MYKEDKNETSKNGKICHLSDKEQHNDFGKYILNDNENTLKIVQKSYFHKNWWAFPPLTIKLTLRYA